MFKVNVTPAMLSAYTVEKNITPGGVFEVSVLKKDDALDELIGVTYGNNGCWRIKGIPHFESPHLYAAICEVVSSYLTQLSEFEEYVNLVKIVK